MENNMLNNFQQIDKVKLYNVETYIHGDQLEVETFVKELNTLAKQTKFEYELTEAVPSLDGEEIDPNQSVYLVYGIVTEKDIKDLNLHLDFLISDYQQPKVEFIPIAEDFCLMIDGKSDGYVYHYTTIVDMINDGFTWKSNEKFKRMTRMNHDELQHFLNNRKY
jgi:hypothetical protein